MIWNIYSANDIGIETDDFKADKFWISREDDKLRWWMRCNKKGLEDFVQSFHLPF